MGVWEFSSVCVLAATFLATVWRIYGPIRIVRDDPASMTDFFDTDMAGPVPADEPKMQIIPDVAEEPIRGDQRPIFNPNWNPAWGDDPTGFEDEP